MSRTKKTSGHQIKEIRRYCDYQRDWRRLIPELRNYLPERVDFLSIPGDAPKDFIRDAEYRPGPRYRRQRYDSFIAKVGSKFYPNESIIEQLLTRIGQVFGVNVADSKLRIIEGQVRFMSKYFLGRAEGLTHGAEIFELCLGKENYTELVVNRTESSYFTFQMTREAIKNAFPCFQEPITRGFVEMLAFDALIGHNDRHPYNWGVIVPVRQGKPPRFSPIFDTARALFWNIPEMKIKETLDNSGELTKYIRNCRPPIGWDKESGLDFFGLMGLIYRQFPQYRNGIEKLLDTGALKEVFILLKRDFDRLISAERRELITRCLSLRQRLLEQACTL